MVISQMTGTLIDEVTMEDENGRVVEGYRVNTPRGALLLVPFNDRMVTHRWTVQDDNTLSNLNDYTVVRVNGEDV